MLCFLGHALMENRNGLIVQGDLTKADGHGERKAALDMVHRHSLGSTRRLTLGADKSYDPAGFVSDLRRACVTPHVAQKSRYSAIVGRTTRHAGYPKFAAGAKLHRHKSAFRPLFCFTL
jgi:5-methylcytosine-specific restriction endonuclease McrA